MVNDQLDFGWRPKNLEYGCDQKEEYSPHPANLIECKAADSAQ
jgi:hypothetical protein